MEKEIWYQKLNIYFVGFYLIFSICLITYYLANGQLYYATLGLGGILLLLLPAAFERVCGLVPVYQFRFLLYGFSFLAYVVGLAMQGYHFIPLYDKVMHTLSGAFGTFLGVVLFYILKHGRRVQQQDFPLVAIFSISASMAAAGLWEIGEYLVGLFFPCDPQQVALTGVSDTMQDMIVCLVGSLLWLPFLFRYYRKQKADFLMGCFLTFLSKNLSQEEPYGMEK